MTDEIRQNLAARVDEAARAGTTIPQLTIEYPDFSVDDAYDVQRLSIARRFARGEERVGMKMGLTSRAKMEQVGVHEPIYGHLSNGMRVADGGTIEMTGRCHPRAATGSEDRGCRARAHGRHLPQLGLHPDKGSAALV